MVRFVLLSVALILAVLGVGAVPALPGDAEADRVLGQANFASAAAFTSQNGMIFPLGIAMDPRNGRVYVADSANHRVTSWPNIAAFTNGQNADKVIGQANFTSGVANRGGAPAANSLNAPHGVAVDALGRIYVADRDNNRILMFPADTASDPAATIVFGQAGSFTANLVNNGGASAASLHSPQGLAFDYNGTLWVADTANNRVLAITAPGETVNPSGTASTTAGFPAAGVLGQTNFTAILANQGGLASATTLDNPTGVAVTPEGTVYIADNGNNRVLAYESPFTTNLTADLVIGQPNFTSTAVNAFGGVDARGLSNPYGLALDANLGLWLADLGNNRALHFPRAGTLPGGASGVATTAGSVLGQPNFTSAGVTPPSATSLNTPFGVLTDPAGNVYVADSGNRRVLAYDVPIAASTPAVLRLTPDSLPRAAQPFGLGIIARGLTGTPTGSAITNTTTVRFDGEIVNATWSGPNSLLALVPAARLTGPGPWTVTLTTAAGSSAAATVAATEPRALDTTADRVFTQGPLAGSSGTVSARDAGATGDPTVGNRNAASAIDLTDLAVDPLTGRVWGADRFNNRVLGWSSLAARMNNQPAEVVIGQPDFTSGGRNRSQLAPSATGLLLPHGVAVDGSGNLWVADDGNNRVLMYPAPHSTGMAATKVLGQADFTSGAVNRGAGFGAPQANTMAAPWGLFARGTNLYVADADNNRVLQFNNAAAKASGANADFAYGNDGLFTTVLGGVTNQRMNGPRDAAVDSSGNVYVVDIGNQRVLRFFNENRAAVAVYGQPNFTSAVANNGGISAASLANPSSIAIDVANNLYVTELSNNRVLVYRFGSTTAFGVFGQNGSFTTNTAGSSANGLSFPIAITVDGQGNVLIFSDIRRLLFYERPFAPPTATQLSVAFRSQGPGW